MNLSMHNISGVISRFGLTEAATEASLQASRLPEQGAHPLDIANSLQVLYALWLTLGAEPRQASGIHLHAARRPHGSMQPCKAAAPAQGWCRGAAHRQSGQASSPCALYSSLPCRATQYQSPQSTSLNMLSCAAKHRGLCLSNSKGLCSPGSQEGRRDALLQSTSKLSAPIK